MYQNFNRFFKRVKSLNKPVFIRDIAKRSLALTAVLTLLLVNISQLFVTLPIEAAPLPSISVGLPTEGFIGESVTFNLTFSNIGADAGYGPFIDLIFPYNGADGVYPFNPGGESDGFEFVSATFLGTPVTSTVLEFTTANSGCVNHPYAVDSLGVPVSVCGSIGDRLVVLQMPFGSFVPGQPNVDISVTANINSWADEGFGLGLQSRGGFRFGETPLNDFTTDPSVVASFNTNTITPRILSIRKTYSGPENETATGPNFVRQYSAIADIANGQTLTGFTLTDNMPNNITYTGFNSASPAGSTITDAPVINGLAANAPNNDLDVTWSSVTGAGGSNDANMTFSFYGTYLDANNNLVIPESGGCVPSINDINASGTWDPIDPRDTITTVTSNATLNDYQINLCSHTIRKSNSVVNDVAPVGNTPGDTVEYTVIMDVSDYFAYQNLNFEDIISDGQRFDAGFGINLSLSTKGNSTSGSISSANYAITDHFTGGSPAVSPIDGTQEIDINISNELIDRSFFGSGQVVGSCVTVPASGSLVCGAGPTIANVVYRSIIQQVFTDDFSPQNPNVDQGDLLSNSVSMVGDVLDNTNLTSVLGNYSNPSSSSLGIINGILASKSIYAINGVIGTYSTPKVGPGDTITYKVTFELPVSDVENLVITDYLPLPSLNAVEVTTFNAVVDSTVPAPGTAKFGPDDTFFSFSSITPSLSTNASANTIVWDYGSYQTITESSNIIDILFTVTVSNQPFADGLFLTNQAQSSQGTTNNNVTTATQIAQIELTLPNLSLTKGVVSSDNLNAVYAPSSVGPVAFTTPPGTCARFGPTINSTNLSSSPINSDISNVDAGDIVTFAVVVENQGQGVNGAFDIRLRDAIPAGFTVPSGGLNLCVTDGTGSPLTYTAIDGGDVNPFIEDGIELTDGVTSGALAPNHPTNGENIAIITYNLQLVNSVNPLSVHINNARLANYAASNSGPDFTTVDILESATTTIANAQSVKTITGTNVVETTGNNVAIGEIVDYSVVLRIPEGVTQSAQLIDTLDSGLAIHSITSVTPSSGVSTDYPGGFAGILAGAVIGVNGSTLTLDFDNLTNANTDNTVADTITINYRVVVLNQSGIVRGSTLNNSANFTFTGGNVASSAPNVTVQEPTLTVSKTPSPTTADNGDNILFTITVQHNGASNLNAHNVSLLDVIPAGLTYAGGLIHTGGVAPATLTESSGTITATWSAINLGQTSTLQFNATVGTLSLGSSVTNTASIQWSSLAGTVNTPQSPYNTNSIERTGSGGVNNYSASGNGVVNIFSASPTKTIRSTSEAHTTIVSGVERVSIGEIVRYRLQIRVAEATALNLQLRDVLATNMQFINDGTAMVAFVSDGAGITSSSLIPGTIGCDGGVNPDLVISGDQTTVGSIVPECPLPNTAVSDNALTNSDVYSAGTDPFFKFGDITNSDADSNQELILIEFNAIVLNVVANQSNTTINNTFEVLVNGSNIGTSSAGTASRVIVAAPSISLAKSVTLAPFDAGDPITYQITATNTSAGVNSAASFDLRILDDVSLANVTVTGVSVSTPNSFTDNTLGNNIDVLLDRLNPGQVAIVTINGTVDAGVSAGESLQNTSAITFTSLPGSGTLSNATGSISGTAGTSTGERTGQNGQLGSPNNYANSASSQTLLNNALIEKLEPNPTLYSIGDNVTYYLRVTIPEGTVNDLNVIDVLPLGLDYSSYQVITSSTPGILTNNFVGTVPTPTVTGGAGSGDDVTFNFSSVTVTSDNNASNNSFVVQVNANVLNVASNQLGVNLVNSATMNFNDPNNTLLNITVNAPLTRSITIQEPILRTQKTATVIPSPVQDGSIVTYEIVVDHHPNSNATAHQVVINDPVNSNLINITNVNISTTGSISVPTFDLSGGAIRVPDVGSITIPDDGSSVIITFDAEVDAGANTTITNIANTTWSSNAVSNSQSRDHTNGVYDLTESNGSGLNDYSSTDSDSSVSTAAPSIQKVLLNSSSSFTSIITDPIELTIGEDITFYLIANVPEGLTADLDIVDDLAPNVEYISHQIISTASASNGNLVQDFNGSVPTPTCTNCISGNDGANLTFEFTNINVATDGVGTNNFFIVEVVAKVLDLPLNDGVLPIQSLFGNQSSIQANSGIVNSSNILNFGVVEPNLTISKEFDTGLNPDAASPNQEFTVNVEIANSGLSPAHEVVWNDNLDLINPGLLIYQTGSINVNCSAGVSSVFNLDESGDPVLSGSISTLPAGESCDISFDLVLLGTVDYNVNPTVTNSTNVVYTSHPGTQSGERNYGPTTSTDVLDVQYPDMSVIKTDGQTSTVQSELLVYELTVDNVGSANAIDVIVEETVPANTTFVPSSSTSGWVCLPDNNAGSTCEFDVSGSIGGPFTPSTPQLVLDFAVLVDNPLNALVSNISNTAEVTMNPISGVDPNLTNNISTDINTVSNVVDLYVVKDDGVASIAYNQNLVYTINYGNQGRLNATGVVLTETVPADTAFNSTLSTLGWSCLPDNNAGSICTFNIGNVNIDSTGSVQFAVTVNDYLPLISSISNTVTVADDGSNGPEATTQNNSSNLSTPVLYSNVFDPPSANKTFDASGLPVMNWKMVWINDGNITALFVRIVDPIPVNTTYVSGSFNCEARGISTTTSCTYDSINNQVVWEGNIGADFGGTNESNSLNEVVLTYQTTIPLSVDQVVNQAEVFWDDNGNGDIEDDILAGQQPSLSNDPSTFISNDPTVWQRGSLTDAGFSMISNLGIGVFGLLGLSIITFTRFNGVKLLNSIRKRRR